MADEVDVGNEEGGGDDDGDRGDEVAGGKAENKNVTKLAALPIEHVG